MNQQQREELRRVMHRIACFNDECEEAEHTDTGDAWDVLGDAHDTIEALFTPTKEPFEVEEMLVLSTAHVTEDTAKRLNAIQADGNITINGYICDWSIYGWVYWTDAEPDESIPDELATLAAFAKARGHKFLRFDCDGPTLSQFPTFEW